jgi:signal transduction histidine kinase
MSKRKLSMLLGALLVVGVILAVGLMVYGPRDVEEQTVQMVELHQNLLAEQAATRMGRWLGDLEVRLATASAEPGVGLHGASSRAEMEHALGLLAYPRDAQAGINLAVVTRAGRVLAVDPDGSEEDLPPALALGKLDLSTASTWTVPGVCNGCVGDEELLVMVSELGNERLAVGTVNLDLLSDFILGPLGRVQSTRAALRTGQDETIYSVGASVEADDDWVSGQAPVAGTDWRVEVAVPRAAVEPAVRSRATTMLAPALGILIVLLVGLAVLVAIKWREHHENLARVRALAHQDKLATLGMLAATTAHEIRNAITVANLQLSVAADNADEDNLEHLRSASAAVDRLATLAENLSGYAGKADPEPRRFDLGEAAAEALDIVRPKLHHRARIHLETGSSLEVIGTKGALTQAVVNLVLNAYDAASEQSDPEVDVRVERQDQRAVLSVTDNGPGIDEQLLDKIFEPFFTTKSDGHEGGTGIGLWLCRQIAAQHDGEIRAQNTESGGAMFTISIPIASDEPVDDLADEAQAADEAPAVS